MQRTADILAAFKPAQQTIDSHLDTTLAAPPLATPPDATFLRQLVYGTLRYAPLLAAFKAAFFHHCGGSALRKDAQLYSMLTYLAVLRIEELGIAQLEAILRACDAQKAAVWAGFVFDEAHLRGELREEWSKVYDKAWVDARIGAPLLQVRPRHAQPGSMCAGACHAC